MIEEKCKWLHEILETLPVIKYPFDIVTLPDSGIYFFYEEGEKWGHGGEKMRIVRVGTHKKENFKSRIADHFLINRRTEWNRNKPKPSDRSIFRKNLGRALLNRENDPYLEVWEIDFTPRKNRERFGHLRDIEKEKEIEEKITQILRTQFSFRFILWDNESNRKEIENKLIGTLANCSLCKPSSNWLGLHSPKWEIRKSGLWVVRGIYSPPLTAQDMREIENAVKRTTKFLDI